MRHHHHQRRLGLSLAVVAAVQGLVMPGSYSRMKTVRVLAEGETSSSTESGKEGAATVAAGATLAATASLATTAATGACATGACAVGAGAAATAVGGTTIGAQVAAFLGAASVGALGFFAPAGGDLAHMAAASVDLPDAVANGRPSVLEFYSRQCPHCNEAAKTLYSVERKHASDINWVMIDTQDPSNQLLWQSLGVNEIPHFAFLDADENLRATAIGAIDADVAERGIKLASQPAQP